MEQSVEEGRHGGGVEPVSVRSTRGNRGHVGNAKRARSRCDRASAIAPKRTSPRAIAPSYVARAMG